MGFCDNDYVNVVSTGSQEGQQLDAEAAAAIPNRNPGSSLAPAPLGAGGGGRGGGCAPRMLLAAAARRLTLGLWGLRS